jgi:hypothetical protein
MKKKRKNDLITENKQEKDDLHTLSFNHCYQRPEIDKNISR